MRYFLIGLALVVSIAGPRTQEWSPQPGEHMEPPPGWTCQPNPARPHFCNCERECVDTLEDGDEKSHMVVKEDPKCSVFCFPNHCTCPMHNCP